MESIETILISKGVADQEKEDKKGRPARSVKGERKKKKVNLPRVCKMLGTDDTRVLRSFLPEGDRKRRRGAQEGGFWPSGLGAESHAKNRVTAAVTKKDHPKGTNERNRDRTTPTQLTTARASGARFGPAIGGKKGLKTDRLGGGGL